MIKGIALVGTVLFFIAIFVRLSADKKVPQTITDFFNAGTNIFKGAFRG